MSEQGDWEPFFDAIEKQKKGKKVYVVTMHRWGDDESHNYVIGAFSDAEKAAIAGDAERSWRGGKYEYKTSEIELNYVSEEKLEHWKKCR